MDNPCHHPALSKLATMTIAKSDGLRHKTSRAAISTLFEAGGYTCFE
jgi:hypothetical protein